MNSQNSKKLFTGVLSIFKLVIAVSLTLSFCFSAVYGDPGNTYVTYPLTPDARQSTRFDVEISIDGKKWAILPVEEFREVSYVHFSYSGRVTLHIQAHQPGQSPVTISRFRLDPVSYTDILSTKVNPTTLEVKITRPCKLFLNRINDWGDKDAPALHEPVLCIFADPLEDDVPPATGKNIINILTDRGADNTGATEVNALIQLAIDDASAEGKTVYIPAGLYKISSLKLRSNVKIYLSGGARLRVGNIRPSGEPFMLFNVKNVKIYGRGSVDQNGVYLQHDPSGPRSSGYGLVRGNYSDDVIIQDVILQNQSMFNIFPINCSRWVVRNVKSIDYMRPDLGRSQGTDGWDPNASRDMLFDDGFILSGDDCISVKVAASEYRFNTSENIVFTNSVVENSGNGAGLDYCDFFQKPVRRVCFENIDICGGMYGIYSGYATSDSSPNVRISDDYWKNIRIGPVWYSMIQWLGDLGPIDSSYLWNIHAENWGDNLPGSKSTNFIKGTAADRTVTNITLDHFTVGGKLVNERTEELYVGPFTSKIRFANRTPNVITISASDFYTGWKGEQGVFTLKRTGEIDKPLTVYYTIRGVARNGIDYQAITEHVNFPAGSDAVSVLIKPKSGIGVKTVQLILKNDPFQSEWMLGPQYTALMTIR